MAERQCRRGKIGNENRQGDRDANVIKVALDARVGPLLDKRELDGSLVVGRDGNDDRKVGL